jgi:putative oxidoreductase
MTDLIVKNTVVPLILRLAVAAVFIFHGSQMVQQENQWGAAWHKPPPPEQAEKSGPPNEAMDLLRYPAGQMAVAWGEFIGGIALGVGFLTRLAALGIIVIMGGAIYAVHLPNGFDLTKGGFEYNVVLIAVCLCLMLTGGGMLAVDRIFRLRRRKAASRT